MLRSFYLLAALCLSGSFLQAQGPVQQLQNLENLVKQQEAGYLRDFAPNLFQKSQSSIEALRKEYEKTGKIADSDLRASKTSFDLYTSTAERTKQILGNCHKFHLAVLHHNFAREYDAKAFYNSKKDYDEAIAFGEKQKFDKTTIYAQKAKEGYKKLLKQSQQRLKSQISPQLKQYETALNADLKALQGTLGDPDQVGPLDGVSARAKLDNFGLGDISIDLFNDNPPYFPPPPVPPGPIPPVAVGIIRRDPDALRIAWHDRSDNEVGNRVLRTTNLSDWETISDRGVLEKFARHTYTDPNLQASTRYCYQIETYNAEGARQSQFRCAYTRDTAVIPIWRLQLKVKVANVANADTDDEMFVALDEFGTATYLDYGIDDFERNRAYYYDLGLDNISRLSDIVSFRLGKNGSDHLLIDSIVLLANNNRVLFSRSFGGTPLDLAGAYNVSHDELRESAEWQQFITESYDSETYNIPPIEIIGAEAQVVISNAEIVSRVEGLFGHMIHAEPSIRGNLKWGGLDGPAVEITQVSNTTLHVDLDLEAIIDYEIFVDIVPNLNLDLGFDLVFSKECVDDNTMRVNFISQNFTYNTVLGSWLQNKLIDWFNVETDAPASIEQQLEFDLPSGMSCDDMQVSINEDGALVICCFPIGGN